MPSDHCTSDSVTHPPAVRVLELVRSLANGGMENQLVALINRIDADACQFEVCCLRELGVNAAKLSPDVPVHCLEKPEGFRWQSVRQLRTILNRGFDLIHTHNLGSLIYATLATNGGRTCSIFHGEHAQLAPDELQWKKMLQRRLLFRLCKAIHTVSDSQQQELVRLGLGHPRLTSIVNGVNTCHFRPADSDNQRIALRRRMRIGDESALIIGIVGRFGDFKRHLELVSAVEQMVSENSSVHLLMVGDGGPLKQNVLDRIDSSACRPNLHWVGYQADPLPYYQVLDLLVVPSANEGLSNATLEAMATGVPVLSNANCGAVEIMGADQGGWVRDLASVDLIRIETQRILSMSSEQRSSMGRIGRERVKSAFSWDHMRSEYLRWFAHCAGRDSLSSPSL